MLCGKPLGSCPCLRDFAYSIGRSTCHVRNSRAAAKLLDNLRASSRAKPRDLLAHSRCKAPRRAALARNDRTLQQPFRNSPCY